MAALPSVAPPSDAELKAILHESDAIQAGVNRTYNAIYTTFGVVLPALSASSPLPRRPSVDGGHDMFGIDMSCCCRASTLRRSARCSQLPGMEWAAYGPERVTDPALQRGLLAGSIECSCGIHFRRGRAHGGVQCHPDYRRHGFERSSSCVKHHRSRWKSSRPPRRDTTGRVTRRRSWRGPASVRRASRHVRRGSLGRGGGNLWTLDRRKRRPPQAAALKAANVATVGSSPASGCH